MSGCPVKASGDGGGRVLGRWFGGGAADTTNTTTTTAAITVVVPDSVEESLAHGQAPRSDQRVPLDTTRVVSSIPRGQNAAPAPDHQNHVDPSAINGAHGDSDGDRRWVYPSEQQFYNAMRRKGWDANEADMNAVVRVHNAVNERAWREVRRWERDRRRGDDRDNGTPRLARFVGRPNDPSPKATLRRLVGGAPPFDRHDWYVEDDATGDVTRYVIDFYDGNGNGNGGPLPSVRLDVRPALDRPSDVLHRARSAIMDLLPGIFPRS